MRRHADPSETYVASDGRPHERVCRIKKIETLMTYTRKPRSARTHPARHKDGGQDGL